jgi:biopolymer transport protein ExbD
MGAKLGSSGTIQADLNLTPLIDIVLVVLIIMMVNMPIEIEAMGVKLPPKTQVTPPPDTDVEQMVVAIYDDGKIALNRKIMTEEYMFQEVTRRLKPLEQKNVFIDAGPTIKFERVVDMIDMARAAGAAKVGLAKLKESGPLPATSIASGALPRQVLLGSPTVIGGITEKAADDALRPYKGALEKCYYPLLGTNPELTGTMMLRFTIGPQGELMGTKISSSKLEPKEVPELDACIELILPQVKFQPLGEGKTAIAQVPVVFSPG